MLALSPSLLFAPVPSSLSLSRTNEGRRKKRQQWILPTLKCLGAQTPFSIIQLAGPYHVRLQPGGTHTHSTNSCLGGLYLRVCTHTPHPTSPQQLARTICPVTCTTRTTRPGRTAANCLHACTLHTMATHTCMQARLSS